MRPSTPSRSVSRRRRSAPGYIGTTSASGAIALPPSRGCVEQLDAAVAPWTAGLLDGVRPGRIVIDEEYMLVVECVAGQRPVGDVVRVATADPRVDRSGQG
jgi:hypothetical protein